MLIGLIIAIILLSLGNLYDSVELSFTGGLLVGILLALCLARHYLPELFDDL